MKKLPVALMCALMLCSCAKKQDTGRELKDNPSITFNHNWYERQTGIDGMLTQMPKSVVMKANVYNRSENPVKIDVKFESGSATSTETLTLPPKTSDSTLYRWKSESDGCRLTFLPENAIVNDPYGEPLPPPEAYRVALNPEKDAKSGLAFDINSNTVSRSKKAGEVIETKTESKPAGIIMPASEPVQVTQPSEPVQVEKALKEAVKTTENADLPVLKDGQQAFKVPAKNEKPLDVILPKNTFDAKKPVQTEIPKQPSVQKPVLPKKKKVIQISSKNDLVITPGNASDPAPKLQSEPVKEQLPALQDSSPVDSPAIKGVIPQIAPSNSEPVKIIAPEVVPVVDVSNKQASEPIVPVLPDKVEEVKEKQ